MIQVAVVGFGNVGKCACEAVQSEPDMVLRCVVEPLDVPDMPPKIREVWVKDLTDIQKHGTVDVAVLCLPSRMCPQAAEALLDMGIHTVDGFDVFSEVWKVKCHLDQVAKKNGKACVIASGWAGADSVVRALMEAMAPRGLTYTNYGPGMSMGHTVAVKAIEGIKNAMSVTIPVGEGMHRRMVYVELEPGASLQEVTKKIKADPYFINDETHVIPVDDVGALMDMGHSVEMTRKGMSGKTSNQRMTFTVSINNPALTSQVFVSLARAVVKQAAGCYTIIEIPPIDMLPGDKQKRIERLI